MSDLEVLNVKEHVLLANNISAFRKAISHGTIELRGWEGRDLAIFEYDWAESPCVPMTGCTQPGPLHFLNKVKVHELCICDHSHQAMVGRMGSAHPPIGSCECARPRHCYTYDERSCASKGHTVSLCMLRHFTSVRHACCKTFISFCDGAFKSNLTIQYLMVHALVDDVSWMHGVYVPGHSRSGADRVVADQSGALARKDIYTYERGVEGCMGQGRCKGSATAQEEVQNPNSVCPLHE